MATKIDDLFFEISVRKGPGADAEIQKFAGQFRKVGTESKAAGAGVQQFGARATSASGASAVLGTALKRLLILFGGFAILRGITRAMVGFETAIAEISTIADPTATNVEQLTRGIAALARESPQSPDDIGAGAYQILSAGITDTNDALEVLRIATRAATAGVTTTEVAVDAITTVINAFGLAAGDAQRVADVLFTTVRLGRVKFEQIASSIGSAATSAALAGVTIEELSAGIVALTLAGINSQEATSSLNRLFLTLTSQSKEQTRAFKDLGIEFSISTVKAKGFAGLLAEVAKITGDDIDALAKLFPNIRAARSAFVIAGVGADNFAEALEKLNNAVGATDLAFAKIARTSKAQAQILKNNLTVTFQEIGLAVLPSVAKAFGFLSESIGDFILQVKVTGADLAVFEARAVLFFKRFRLAGAQALQGLVDNFLGFEVRLGQFFQRAAAALPRSVPGAAILSDALQLAGDNFVKAGEATRDFVGDLADGIDEQERFVQAVIAARDEVVVLALAEQEFTNTLKDRQEAELAAAQATAAIAKRTEEQIKLEDKLRQQLGDLVAQQTLTAVEQQERALDKLEAKFRATFGEIPEIAARDFARLRQVIADARIEEAATAIAEEFGQRLSEGLEAIEIETIGIEDETVRTNAQLERQRALLAALVTDLQARLKLTDLTEKEERALQRALVTTTKELRKINSEEKDRLKAATTAEQKLAQQRFESLQTTIGLIRLATEGTADLANAFGLVDDATLKVIDNLLQAGQAAQTVINAIATGAGGISAIVAGGVGVIGALTGLLGGGPSPEALARQKILQENIKALRELRDSVVDLKGSFDITGGDFAKAAADLVTFELELGSLISLIEAGIGVVFSPEEIEALGINLANLDRVAKELGITIRDEAGNIIPKALLDLQRALDAVEESLIGFPDTIAGIFARLQAEFDIFDVTDPIEQFRRLQEALLDIQTVDAAEIGRILADTTLSLTQRMMEISKAFTAAGANLTPFLAQLLAIDVTTAEGRQQAEQLIRTLFTQLAEGIITPEALGAATFEEAVEILRKMESLLDNIDDSQAEGTGELEGQTQDIRRTVQITELQASQLLAFQSTLVIRAEQRNILLQAILAAVGGGAIPDGEPTGGAFGEPRILPPEPVIPPAIPEPEPTAIQRVETQTINLDVDIAEIVVGPGATPEDAEEAAEILVDRVSVVLGERLGNQDRILGIRRR